MKVKFSIFTASLGSLAVMSSVFFFAACNRNVQKEVEPIAQDKTLSLRSDAVTEKLLKSKDFMDFASLIMTMEAKKNKWLSTLSSTERERLFNEASNYRQTKKLPNLSYASKEQQKEFYQTLKKLLAKLKKEYSYSNNTLNKALYSTYNTPMLSNGRIEDNCTYDFISCLIFALDDYLSCDEGSDCPLIYGSDSMVCTLKLRYCQTGQW